MDNILSRNVGEISEANRHSLEDLLGCSLQPNQRVLDSCDAPTAAQRREAAHGLREIITLAERHANEQGVSKAEADSAVEEAMAQVRRRAV